MTYVCNGSGVWYQDILIEIVGAWNYSPLVVKLLLLSFFGVNIVLTVSKKYKISISIFAIIVILFLLFSMEILGDCWA